MLTETGKGLNLTKVEPELMRGASESVPTEAGRRVVVRLLAGRLFASNCFDACLERFRLS